MHEILTRLERIEIALATLISQRSIKDFYSTDELAAILGKAEFTVREWAGAEESRPRNAAVDEENISRGPSPTKNCYASSGKDYCPKTERMASCCVDGYR